MNVLEIIITVFSNIIFLHTYLACFQSVNQFEYIDMIYFKTFSFLPKQYADEQISKGVSSYTKKFHSSLSEWSGAWNKAHQS